MLTAQPMTSGQTYSPTGKTAAVNPVGIGQSSNVFTCVTTVQNQVWADNSLDMVAFIHRSDVGTWGGSSGHLRFDLSIDGGNSFTTDIGPVNNDLTRVARYPNITGFNPQNATDPFNTKVVYSAVTLDPNASFDGHVVGTSTVSTGGPITTENYINIAQGSYITGGLCQGLPGEFWSVDREWLAAAFTGRLFINKGVYDAVANDVIWVRHDTVTPPNNISINANGTVSNPNIAFSPDGSIGWIAWMGDLIGGSDSVLSPVFMKSSDGGMTWGTPVEYNLNSLPWVADSLRTLWVDSTNATISTGRATCAFDFDLVVDHQGNPHFAGVIGSGSINSDPAPSYSIYPGLAKFLTDVWTPDGGATWTMAYISPVLTFSGDFGTGASGAVRMDNNVQVARHPSNNEIYYSWVDSDTSQFTGSMSGIGFGVSDNLAPNLRIAGRRPYQNTQTYPKRITDGDLTWEGRALWPTMAPIALNSNSCSQLPIVMADLLNNDGYSTVKFWYFGNDATICGADFCDVEQMQLWWTAITDPNATPFCNPIARQDPKPAGSLQPVYPNPTSDAAILVFELAAAGDARLVLRNLYGQEVKVVTEGAFAAGSHRIDLDTRQLGSGVYFATLYAGGQTSTQKMVVQR